MNLKIVGSVHEEEKCKYSKGILYIPRWIYSKIQQERGFCIVKNVIFT